MVGSGGGTHDIFLRKAETVFLYLVTQVEIMSVVLSVLVGLLTDFRFAAQPTIYVLSESSLSDGLLFAREHPLKESVQVSASH